MDQRRSHELRLAWASSHVDRLVARVREWREHPTHRYDSRIDRESDNQFVYIRFPEPVPAELRLIIGDCLHNLRSALDNLVYDLALAYNEGNPLHPDVEEKVMFPIFNDSKKFKRRGAWRIEDIDPDAQTVIKDLQPYNRGDEYASHPLWKLHQLSNIDKHRVPHVTRVAVESVSDHPQVRHLPGRISIDLVPLEDGTKIATYFPLNSAFAEGFDPQTDMDPLLTFGISFELEAAASGEHCSATLRMLHSYISNEVLPNLVPPFLDRP